MTLLSHTESSIAPAAECSSSGDASAVVVVERKKRRRRETASSVLDPELYRVRWEHYSVRYC